MLCQVEEPDPRKLAADALGTPPYRGRDNQAAQLGRPVHRMPQPQILMPEHPAKPLRIALFVINLQIKVR